jgi:hypothetical protein
MNRLENNDDITLVTAFYDIGRHNWEGEFKRNISFYIDSFFTYLNYEYKMVCFIDDRYIDKVLEKYTESPYKNKIFIPINRKWLDNTIRAWKNVERDRAIMENEEYKNFMKNRLQLMYPEGIPETNVRNHLCPENVFPEYNVVNHSKIDFIAYAINNGFINTKYTGWTDFGYFKTYHNDDSPLPHSTIDINKLHPTKIIFNLRKSIDERDKDIIYTMFYAFELFIGAFYAGPTDLMLPFQELYHECVTEMLNRHVTDDDQHVYIQCYVKRPDWMHLNIYENQDWPKALVVYQKDAKN